MNAVDTNVLFYAMDPTDPAKQLAAAQFVRSTPDIALPWQVLCELANGVRKLEARGVLRQEAQGFVKDLPRRYPILLPTTGVLGRALHLQERYSLSFWDALLVAACLEAKVETLYSEDLTAYQKIDGLKLVNLFAGKAARR
jgi:predicted nucleic acid-binding protein